MELKKVISLDEEELKKYKYCPYCGSKNTLAFNTFYDFILMECVHCNKGTYYSKL